MSENTIALKLALSGVSSVTNGLKQVGAALGAAVAANLTVGNFVRLTAEVIKSADEMGKLAQKTGILTEALSGLSYAAQLGDLSAEELANSLKFLGKAMAEQGDFTTNLDDRLMELADQFAAMPDGVAKNKLALENFGKAGLAIIPFLNQGSEAIRKQREEAKEFGLVIDETFAKNADEFRDNIFRIEQMLKGVFFQAVKESLPAFLEITNQIIRLSKESGGLVAAVEVVGAVFKWASAHVQVMTEQIAALLYLVGSDKWEKFYDAADAIDKARNGVAASAASTPASRTGAIDAEDVKKATDMLRQFNNEYLRFLDARLGATGAEEIRFADEKDKIQKMLIDEQGKNELLEAAEFDHKLRISQIHQEFEDRDVELVKQREAEKARIREQAVKGASDMFGNLAETAKAFGEKGFAAWKAFATAQALVNTYSSAVGAYNAMVGIPYVGPALAVAAAAAAVGAGLANVAAIQSTNPSSGYFTGGYTGDGSATSIAGNVHGREFVFSAPATANIGVGNLAALHDAARTGSPVSVGGGSNVNVGVFFSQSAVRDFLKSPPFHNEVKKVVLLNRFELGIA